MLPWNFCGTSANVSESDTDPVVIGPTIQEFMGIRYYLRTRYYQRFHRALHRVVWEHHNGPVPSKYHVHHVDGDRGNNRLANLAMLHESVHISQHRKENPSVLTPQARIAGIAFRRSPAGHALAKQTWEEHGRVMLTCQHCGTPFVGYVLAASRSKFCHRNCQAKYLRKKWKAERL